MHQSADGVIRLMKRKSKKLPSFLRQYFWDVNFDNLDLQKKPLYILSKILEYGDEKSVAWMKENFTSKQVEEVLLHYRSVSPKSANYWALLFDINKKKVLCLQNHYLKMRKKVWPY